MYINQKKQVLLRYDFESDSIKRDPVTGFCEIAGPNEPGEDVVRIAEIYKAYNSEDDNLKKVHRDVFEKGDIWYRSGDLLRFDEDGFFYFVDRVGDTFRWKGENVSTNEVSEAITKALDDHIGLKEANVYGVEIPGCEGRAGMARLLLEHDNFYEIDTKLLVKELKKHLPHYAIPLFLRISNSESEKTSTLKFVKYQYQKEGFNPNNVGADRIFFLNPDTKDDYMLVTDELLKTITSGTLRI